MLKIYRFLGGQTRQTDRKTDRHTDRQVDKETGRKLHVHYAPVYRRVDIKYSTLTRNIAKDCCIVIKYFPFLFYVFTRIDRPNLYCSCSHLFNNFFSNFFYLRHLNFISGCEGRIISLCNPTFINLGQRRF